MTGKADYTEEEWKLLREAPTSAGMLVIQADRGGAIRESFSMAKAYADARKEHGASQLLDDVTSEKPEVDRTRFESAEDLRTSLLQHIRDAVSLATRPVKELRGFRRVTLRPGETRTITFEIGPEQLAYHGPDMKRVVEPGRFDVMVGGNSVDVLSAALDVVEQR